MYQFINLPDKNGPAIKGIAEDHRFHIVSAQPSGDVTICEIERGSPDMIAQDIASAIRYARDAGYQQALRDVRRTLGIE